jgi:hypothetical protein
MVFAYQPAIRAAAFVAGGGTLAYLRPLSPPYRPMFGQDLAARVPSLLNSADGMRTIDGVAVVPFFNESLPLRDQPPVTDPAPGATAIQRVLDRKAWAEQIARAAAFAPLLRRAPPPGVLARPFVFQFARSDPAAVNPASSETVRAGGFADRVTYYRHDLNFGRPGAAGRAAHLHHGAAAARQLRARRDRRAAADHDALRDGWCAGDSSRTHGALGGPDQGPLAEDLFFLPR